MMKSQRLVAAYRREAVLDWLRERYGLDVGFLADDLPPVILRREWNKLRERFGLPITSRSLANMDSKGIGPERIR